MDVEIVIQIASSLTTWLCGLDIYRCQLSMFDICLSLVTFSIPCCLCEIKTDYLSGVLTGTSMM
jgi:hypothetical protein